MLTSQSGITSYYLVHWISSRKSGGTKTKGTGKQLPRLGSALRVRSTRSGTAAPRGILRSRAGQGRGFSPRRFTALPRAAAAPRARPSGAEELPARGVPHRSPPPPPRPGPSAESTAPCAPAARPQPRLPPRSAAPWPQLAAAGPALPPLRGRTWRERGRERDQERERGRAALGAALRARAHPEPHPPPKSRDKPARAGLGRSRACVRSAGRGSRRLEGGWGRCTAEQLSWGWDQEALRKHSLIAYGHPKSHTACPAASSKQSWNCRPCHCDHCLGEPVQCTTTLWVKGLFRYPALLCPAPAPAGRPVPGYRAQIRACPCAIPREQAAAPGSSAVSLLQAEPAKCPRPSLLWLRDGAGPKGAAAAQERSGDGPRTEQPSAGGD